MLQQQTSTTLSHIMCMFNKHTAFIHRGYSSKMILLLYILIKNPLKSISNQNRTKNIINTIKTPICHVKWLPCYISNHVYHLFITFPTCFGCNWPFPGRSFQNTNSYTVMIFTGTRWLNHNKTLFLIVNSVKWTFFCFKNA